MIPFGQMKTCSECRGKMEDKKGKTPEGLIYSYYKCRKCGEEIVDMKQLHQIAKKYKLMKKYHVKLNQWGLSLGIRIPKEIIKKYHFHKNEEATIIPEKEGILIIPASFNK